MKKTLVIPAGFLRETASSIRCPFCGKVQDHDPKIELMFDGWLSCRSCQKSAKINPGSITVTAESNHAERTLRFRGLFPEGYPLPEWGKEKPEAESYAEELYFSTDSLPMLTLLEPDGKRLESKELSFPDAYLEWRSSLLGLIARHPLVRDFFMAVAEELVEPDCRFETAYDFGLVLRFGYSLQELAQFPFRNRYYELARSSCFVCRDNLLNTLEHTSAFLPSDFREWIAERAPGLMFYTDELRLLLHGLKGQIDLLFSLFRHSETERIFSLVSMAKSDPAVRAVLIHVRNPHTAFLFIRFILMSEDAERAEFARGRLNQPRATLFSESFHGKLFRFDPVLCSGQLHVLEKNLGFHKIGLLPARRNLFWISVCEEGVAFPTAALGVDMKEMRLSCWVDRRAYASSAYCSDLWADIDELAKRYGFRAERDWLKLNSPERSDFFLKTSPKEREKFEYEMSRLFL